MNIFKLAELQVLRENKELTAIYLNEDTEIEL